MTLGPETSTILQTLFLFVVEQTRAVVAVRFTTLMCFTSVRLKKCWETLLIETGDGGADVVVGAGVGAGIVRVVVAGAVVAFTLVVGAMVVVPPRR